MVRSAPAVCEVNGREFVLLTVSGGNPFPTGGRMAPGGTDPPATSKSYIAFALPKHQPGALDEILRMRPRVSVNRSVNPSALLVSARMLPREATMRMGLEMAEMWTLGGLSMGELLRRTVRESWEDSVFGQSGRMAFYQFLAIFPCLFVFMDLIGRFFQAGNHVSGVIGDLSREVFPEQVSGLFVAALERLRSQPLSDLRLAAACAGAAWSGLNGTWAMVYGLNRAYEVDERRSWGQLGLTIAGITLCLAVTGAMAVFVIFGSADLEARLRQGTTAGRITEWLVLVVAVLFSFAILYRFAPNLPDPEWQWSTPGAVCALFLWIGATIGVRYYFGHVTDYSAAYGPLNGVAIYLLWLYATDSAILIGGEMNSEIEKARGARRSRSYRDTI